MPITGVPGAGKTALMDRVANDRIDRNDGPRTALAVELSVEDIGNPKILADILQDSLPSEAGNIFALWISSLGFGIGGISASVGIREQEESSDLKELDRPVAPMIDEIQNIPANRNAIGPQMLRKRYVASHGEAVIPILARLAHSQVKLEAIGIWRLGSESVLSLGALGEGEVAESVSGFMGRFKVKGERKGWPERIADWSDGWPMHLHNTLTALARELARNDGNLD